ncbi:hypothetical protein SKAU_G00157320 [Synaphobranchus kaupii]|uniref:SGNH hydrolase-type esterase domain-containing protein n=1 Tax=Synaphobranchus kaupii TaxID=118154 RepID=A0A9Q1IZK0_SYNKA|nr:hypothetical protein SKAU_G00157320 [Synaphobranchus kaupii]
MLQDEILRLLEIIRALQEGERERETAEGSSLHHSNSFSALYHDVPAPHSTNLLSDRPSQRHRHPRPIAADGARRCSTPPRVGARAAAAFNGAEDIRPAQGCPESYTGGLLIVGSSIVRDVDVPGGKTICFPGARVSDINKQVPSVLKQHPSAHTLIIHVGFNDIRLCCSLQLKRDFEELWDTLSGTGKHFLISGPLAVKGRDSESFSRLLSLDNWLRSFCTATGIDYIENFDTYWNKPHLLKRDGLHPNSKGAKLLSTNYVEALK